MEKYKWREGEQEVTGAKLLINKKTSERAGID